jgi:hypothetical protein
MASPFSTPFQPIGKTSAILANSTAPNGVLLVDDPTAGTMEWKQYKVCNPSNMTVFYTYAANANAAASAAVIPTNASVGAQSYPITAGATQIVTTRPGQYWSAITAANFGGQGFYVTPGVGF